MDTHARIPFPRLLDAWRRAEALLDDPSLGLHIIAATELRPMERLQHESEWVVLQLFVVSATVGEGLQRFARFFPVGFYGSELVLERSEADRALLIRHVVPFGCDVPRSFSEFILGLVIRMLQELPVHPVRARELRLRHAAPPSPAEHERVLGTQVTFAAAESSIRIDESELATALRAPNPTLAASLLRIAGEQLASLAPTESLVEKVRALLVAELPAGGPSAERIAEALQLSVRTLARRLAQHGTSHQALLDEVRARLARRYLQEERRPVAEVAELLGFAEPSTFHRAFKRWYGVAPTSFRDKDRDKDKDKDKGKDKNTDKGKEDDAAADAQVRLHKLKDEQRKLEKDLARAASERARQQEILDESFVFQPSAQPTLRTGKAGKGALFVPSEKAQRAPERIPSEALPRVGALLRHKQQRFLVIEKWSELEAGQQEAARLSARLVAPLEAP